MSSLPHRQLRNTGWCSKALPNRVHCRIGSSETSQGCVSPGASVHCRIGSSETEHRRYDGRHPGSLPHRQLRNCSIAVSVVMQSFTAA